MRAGTFAALAAFSAATALVTLAAFVLPSLLGRTGRASRVLIASLAWNALVIVPVYALGLADQLYRGPLALAASAGASGVLAIAFARLGVARAVREAGRTAMTFVRLPIDAFRIAVSEGSFAIVAVSLAFGLCAWLTAQAVLEPTWGDWDCLWYHEPMIGFAIQNHGFNMVALEPHAQKINGYPRLSEMTMLWFGIFHGRWAIDLVNPMFLPLFAVSTYALCRDLGATRATSIGFGSAMVIVPGVVRLVPTTMVDPHASALFVAATYFACRSRFDLRDGLVGIVAVTLAIGAKTFLVIPGFFVCVTLLVRIIRRRRTSGALRVAATTLLGVASTTGILAFTHLRNYRNFHNPLWPDLRVDLPRWNIHWPGNYVFDDPSLPTGEQVNADVPLAEFARYLFSPPFSINSGHNWQIVDYGAGVAYSLLPLGAIITFVAIVESTYRLTIGKRQLAPIDRARWATVLRIAIPLVVTMFVSPAPYIGRYHLALIAIAMAVVAGHSALRSYPAFASGIMAVVTIGSLMTVAWNTRGWIASPRSLAALASLPVPERYVKAEFGSAITEDVGLARERELGAGSVVMYERIAYLGLLWNDHYSNRVEWTEDDRDPIARANRRGARWLYARRGGWLDTHASSPGSGWTPVGTLETENFGVVYRRANAR